MEIKDIEKAFDDIKSGIAKIREKQVSQIGELGRLSDRMRRHETNTFLPEGHKLATMITDHEHVIGGLVKDVRALKEPHPLQMPILDGGKDAPKPEAVYKNGEYVISKTTGKISIIVNVGNKGTMLTIHDLYDDIHYKAAASYFRHLLPSEYTVTINGCKVRFYMTRDDTIKYRMIDVNGIRRKCLFLKSDLLLLKKGWLDQYPKVTFEMSDGKYKYPDEVK